MTERIIDISGVAMVVTDLHGTWEPYARLRDYFLESHARREIDTLVICGDLIHADKSVLHDASMEMVLDVMRLQRELGRERVVLLLGNHELPHIYGITLAKGNEIFTPQFEAALSALDGDIQRADVIKFLSDAPFYARTKGGVLLSHAGAAPSLINAEYVRRLVSFDHDDLLERAAQHMEIYGIQQLCKEYVEITRFPYEGQARELLAVSGQSDPRYYDLLRGFVISNNYPEFDLLWAALFSQNEREGNLKSYSAIVELFLQRVSEMSEYPLRVLVAGHIGVQDGYAEIGSYQLRLASYTHAKPVGKARFLVFDTEMPVKRARDLVDCLHFTLSV